MADNPLIYPNAIPPTGMTIQVGEYKENGFKSGAASGIKINVLQPFQYQDGGNVVTVQGETVIYWRNDNAKAVQRGMDVLAALTTAGKNLGHSCTLSQPTPGQYVVTEPGVVAPPPQAPPVPQGTPPPASATVHHGQPVAAFSNPRVTPVIGEHLYGMCLQAALKAFKANGLEDVTTDAVGHAATAIYISILKGDTVDPTMCPPTEDDLTF